ncbi:hypothetical protein UT300003_05500 [Clostridium sardiniense]|uniref:hypothetical protein n=1 Tax=Clostridium sardiniense TaxID=29369 RepID=UPI00195B985C|nr:hypothetical protein [Clostridium sardiniense]MBM7834216.1 hypothetical protein [Clostridium sardiniense]
MNNSNNNLKNKRDRSNAVEAARTAIIMGMDNKAISKITILTEDEIQLIRETLDKTSRIF